MKLEAWMVYLWGTIDSVIGLVFGLSIILTAITVGLSIGGFDSDICSDEKRSAQCRKWSFRCGLVALIGWMFFTFIPNSKTLAIMVVAPAIVNSKPIQEDIPEIYNAAIQALKTKLGESATVEK